MATVAMTGLDLRLPIGEALRTTALAPLDPNEIAARAIDAARAAGATYADVRVDHLISQGAGVANEFGGHVSHAENIGVGIRVIADGQWGFVGIDAPTPDVVANAARRAVEQAKVNAKARTTAIELAPAPVVRDGEWATAVVADPFQVPVGELQATMLAGTKAGLAVGGVALASLSVVWQRLRRTFASTDGSRIVQTIALAFPNGSVQVSPVDGAGWVRVAPKGLLWRGGGYEVLRDYALAEGMRAAGEEAQRESRELGQMPARSVDVGRYELVVDAETMGSLVEDTIVSAAGMDRALGKLVNVAGTTFAAPPEKVLGALAMASDQLTVRGDRTLPGGLMTVGWDDEGVKPDEFALVERGVLVDYLATRQTASKLARWYAKRRAPLSGHGCAATDSWTLPGETRPNLSIEPGRATANVEDLIKDCTRGVYLSGADVDVDFGLMNAFGSASAAREIRNGKVVGRLTDVGIQFQTRAFWKGLLAVGGPASQVTSTSGFPNVFDCLTLRSVPGRFREVNVVNTGRTQ
jgi:TldD protein